MKPNRALARISPALFVLFTAACGGGQPAAETGSTESANTAATDAGADAADAAAGVPLGKRLLVSGRCTYTETRCDRNSWRCSTTEGDDRQAATAIFSRSDGGALTVELTDITPFTPLWHPFCNAQSSFAPGPFAACSGRADAVLPAATIATTSGFVSVTESGRRGLISLWVRAESGTWERTVRTSLSCSLETKP
jgi:hypothetical protein